MQKYARPTSTVWAVTLLAAGLASNIFLTCGSNLVAFAVVAAVTLRFRAAIIVALGIWFESQILGFAVFDYPHETMTFAWGAALGVGTIIATGVAAWSAARSRMGAFVAAFAAYELALAAFALGTRSGVGEFTAAIVGQLFASNALIAVCALVVHGAIGWLESAILRGARSRHA